MKRIFIHDPDVTHTLQRSRVTDAELRAVEMAIMRGGGVIIPGTGGLKKIRCGSAGKGKSGSVRVIFADYPGAGRTYLLTAFAKNDAANISGGERNQLRRLKQVLDQVMEKKVHREN